MIYCNNNFANEIIISRYYAQYFNHLSYTYLIKQIADSKLIGTKNDFSLLSLYYVQYYIQH